MFKKRCPKCEKKIDKKFDFCPYCGLPNDNAEDYGMLGLDDNERDLNNMFNNNPHLGFGKGMISGKLFDKMLSGAFKMLEKELRGIDIDQEEKMQRSPRAKANFQLYINGKKIDLGENMISPQIGAGQNIIEQNNPAPKSKKNKIPQVSEETFTKSKKLPRKEAKTKLIRFKEKVIYELDTPGLDSPNKVLINKLENSIEVKVFTAKAVYFKNITIKLPLVSYTIPEEGKLILEFKA